MKELDKEYISKRKDQKAYNYFDSGFVGEILVSTFACASIPCGWNKSTKKIIKPKRITEIAVRKKMRSSMRDKPKDTIPREEKRMQQLNLFDPRTNIHRNVTGEHLSEVFYSLSLSSPSAALFKSI